MTHTASIHGQRVLWGSLSKTSTLLPQVVVRLNISGKFISTSTYWLARGSTVIIGSFAKIAVIAIIAVFLRKFGKFSNLYCFIYIVKMANCGKLCKLQQIG
jgi:hypothetical protein